MRTKNPLYFLLLVLCLSPFITQAQTCEEFDLPLGGADPIVIPGSALKGANESFLTSTQNGVIRNIRLSIAFTGSILPTTQIRLTHLNSGITVTLNDGQTNNELFPFNIIFFFDDATDSVKDWGPMYSPVPFTARPVGSLSDFNGLTTNTTWRLSVVDTTENSIGEIAGWSFLIGTGVGDDIDGDGSNTCVDCNDNNPNIFPGALEIEDALDNNCDSIVDNIPTSLPNPNTIENQGLALNPPKASKLVVRANILKTARKIRVRRGGTLKVKFNEALEQESTTDVALDLGNKSFVVKDGGKGRDARKGDKIFSSKVPNIISEEIRSRVKRIIKIKSNEDLTSYMFEGRRLVSKPLFKLSSFNLRINNKRLAISKIIGKRKNVNRAVKKVMEKVYKMGRQLREGSRFKNINLSFPEALNSIDRRPPPPPVTVDSEKSLIIRDLNTVNDPSRTIVWKNINGVCTPTGNVDGVWSFKTLMKEMANTPLTGITTSEFVYKWFTDGWGDDWNINGNTVHGSFQGVADLLQYWPKTPSGTNTDLSLLHSPFQLIAIVNRLDLRGSSIYGGNHGQLRFVFAFINTRTCVPEEGNIIFEYQNLGTGCSAAKSLANDWMDLSTHSLGSAIYNEALEKLTLPVTSSNASPTANNGSSLLQLRTNETIMAWPHYLDRNWELRDFVIDSSGLLVPDPVDQTPINSAFSLNGATTYRQFPDPQSLNNDPNCALSGLPPFPNPALINSYINANTTSLNADVHKIATTYNGMPLLGGFAIYGKIYTGGIFCGSGIQGFQEGNNYWGDSSITNVEARHKFSLNTCSGCHAREVFDDAGINSVLGAPLEEKFRHIKLASLGTPAVLSRFLTGTDTNCTGNLLVPPLGSNSCSAGCCPIGDAAFGPSVEQYHFNELKRRAIMLENTASNSCLSDVIADTSSVNEAVRFVH